MRLFRDYTPLQVGALLLAVSVTVLADEPLTFQGVPEDELLQAEGKWGGVSGQLVFDGEPPEIPLLFGKGAAVKDRSICAAEDHPDESLLVDETTKGIANCFVYIYVYRRKPIHPLLEDSKSKRIYCEIKSCGFEPRGMVVRKDQTIELCNFDRVPHGTTTFPTRNQVCGIVVSPGTRRGAGMPIYHQTAEPNPMAVRCDYHAWMKAFWLIVDHPYAAITDKHGRFRIIGLPIGEHTFRIWHERVGYIEKEYAVTVSDGKVSRLPPLKIDSKRFGDVGAM